MNFPVRNEFLLAVLDCRRTRRQEVILLTSNKVMLDFLPKASSKFTIHIR